MGWLSDRRNGKRLGELVGRAVSGGTYETACSASQVLAWFAEQEGTVSETSEVSVSMQLVPKPPLRLPNAPVDPNAHPDGGTATVVTSAGRELTTRFEIRLGLDERFGYVNTSAFGPCGRLMELVGTTDPTCKPV
jgi:hypothetical protein